jgi:hypothetical protein
MSTDIPNKATYDRLRGRLQVEPHNIDRDVIELPSQLLEAITCEVEAMNVRDVAKNVLEFVRAQEMTRLRDVLVIDENQKPLKRTEGQFKELCELEDAVQQAVADLETAKYVYELWRGLTESLREKSNSLKRLNELTIAGYITPSSLHEQRREAMGANRKPLTRASLPGGAA